MMIWLTQYFTAKKVSTTATRAPAMGAASRPAYGFFTTEATTAARNAPASSWPSMAMLMMPERSPTRPHMAPKISGTDSARAPASSVVSGITPPDPPPAHARKDRTKITPKSIGNQEPRSMRLTDT